MLKTIGWGFVLFCFVMAVSVAQAKTRSEIIKEHRCTCTNRTTHHIDVCNPYTFLKMEPKVSICGKIKMFIQGEL